MKWKKKNGFLFSQGGLKMADWRNNPVTEKQMTYIQEMQEFSDFPIPRFTGSTKGEASDYIDRWSRRAHEAFDFYGHGDNYGDRRDW